MELLRLRRLRSENRFFSHLTVAIVGCLFIMAMGALESEGPFAVAPLLWVWASAVMIHGFFALYIGRGRAARRSSSLEREMRRRAGPTGAAADPEVAQLRARLSRAAKEAREVVRESGGQAVADVARGETLGLSIVSWLEEARRLLRSGPGVGELRQEVVDSLSRPGGESGHTARRRLLGQLDGREVKLAALEREVSRRQSVLDSFILLLDSAGLAGADDEMLAAVTRPIRERLSLLETVVASPAADAAALGEIPGGRIEEEMRLARDLQRSILPSRAPSVAGLSVAQLYRPSSEVGGDFFDYYAIAEDRLLVAVGDASGHGLDSSMVSSMAKSALYTQVSAGRTLEEAMSELNRMMFDTLGRRRLMTLALVEIDTTARRLTWVNAGQVYPLLRRGGEVRELEQPSYPLGVRARVDYQVAEVGLEPGDLLLLMSDGYVEATDAAGDPYGWERLAERLGDLAGAGPESLIERLEGDLRSYLGGRSLEDDVTLVAIAFEP